MNSPPRDGKRPENASVALAKIVSEITHAHEAELAHRVAEQRSAAEKLRRELASALSELARERNARKSEAARGSAKLGEMGRALAHAEERLNEALRRAETLAAERDELAERSRAMAATLDSERERLKKHAESIIHRIRAEAEGQREAAERSLREELSRKEELSSLSREELRASFEREKAALLTAWREERHAWLAREEKARLEALEFRNKAEDFKARSEKEKSALQATLQRDRQIAHRWAERDRQREAELQIWRHRLSTLESENAAARAESQRLDALLRERHERAENLERELDRVRATYPLRDLHAEKTEQIRKISASIAELSPDFPPEERSRAERVLQLLEIQKTEIETALRNAETETGPELSGQA